jgi:sugar lactone lactonase YvrE
MKTIVNKSPVALLFAACVLAATAPATAQEYTFTTLAGRAGSRGSADGTGSAARFYQPYGVAVDGAGNVYVADTWNGTIRKVTPGGVVTTLAGQAGSYGSADGTGSAARFGQPSGVTVDGTGNAYVADYYYHTIRKVTPGGVVTTLAGQVDWSGSADGAGSGAQFYAPGGVAVDSAGNVYVADTYNHTIRKVTPGGMVTTLAGVAHYSGSADGTGGAARFDYPIGVAVDSAGNVYVGDSYNQTIRKVTPGRVVTTLAGMAHYRGSADGTGSAAWFFEPSGVAVDNAGNVYVADRYNHTIRKVTAGGVVTTLAGLAESFGSADGTGSAARFNYPRGVALDSAGNLYVADTVNHTIRIGRVVPPPAIVRQPLTQTAEIGSMASFDVVVTNAVPGTICQWFFNGATALAGATNACLNLANVQPAQAGTYRLVVTNVSGAVTSAPAMLSVIPAVPRRSVAAMYLTGEVGSLLHLEYTDALGPGLTWQALDTLTLTNSPQVCPDLSAPRPSSRFYRAWQANTPSVRPALGWALATEIMLTGMPGTNIRIDWINQSGPTNAWVTLAAVTLTNPSQTYLDLTMIGQPSRLYRLVPGATAPGYTFGTLAGLAESYGSADGTGSAARFYGPWGVAVDSAGNAYVADSLNHTIRKVTLGGMVTTLAGVAGSPGSADGAGSGARFNFPSGVAVDSAGNVYVADYANHTIRKITPGGMVTTLAGAAGNPASDDGTGIWARFSYPEGVGLDSAGNLYVSDSLNHTIRKVTPGGVVTTLAGLAGSPGSADGTGSAARFYVPRGVAVDSAGNVYVVESGNHTLRKVTPGGVVTTLAGLAGSPGSADGTGSAARFCGPLGVAVDNAGNAYVSEYLCHTIRKVTPGGVVITVAGLAGSPGSADGTGSTARFWGPVGVAVNSAGNLYVADYLNHTVRIGRP